ncbi:MAG: polysaccharide biosynthesis C-terminal domain-containing protein, partial [Kiritimatiellae bacterium]|nr:polysaccharide biosynthesis C-terminal domain-containing protein [Kiritimatiellia bacterium]
MRPYLEIVRLAWPLALGMVNNAVMQFVDRAFLAAHSMEAFESVLPASALSWMFVGFFQSVTAYSGVFVAQYHGAGNGRMCGVCYRAATLIALCSGALVAALAPAANWIILKTAPSAELLEMERVYCGICMSGGFFVCAQMAAASYFTGRGRTGIVFWVNLGGNLLNIALDPFLIFGWCGMPALGIAGAAYATVLSMAAQWLVLAAFAFADMRREAGGEASEGAGRILLRVLRYGVPSGAYSVLNMLSFTVFVFVTEKVGSLECAVSNAVFTVNYLLSAPMEGGAVGAQTRGGQ